MKNWFIFLTCALFLICYLSTDFVKGTASWYSEKSTLAEGYSLVMANGEILDDTKLTCASWDYDFGTLLSVTNIKNNKTVVVRVTDRGPARRLYKKGRIIDLSKKAFSQIAKLDQGLCEVKIDIY